MKIVIVSRRLNSFQSAPKCNLNLACALSELKHEIHVVTSIISTESYQRITKAGVIVHKVPQLCANRQFSPLSCTLFGHRLKRSLSADVLFGNGYTLFDDVTWVHFSRLGWMIRSGVSRKRLYLDSQFEKLLLRTSRLLLAPSSIAADDVRRLYHISDKILIQPHGVDTNYYSSIASEEKKRSPKDETRLLFVGEDPVLKGFHLLIKSIAGLRNHHNLKLFALGFNPDSRARSWVERLGLTDSVFFEGFVTPERLRAMYCLSDLYVLPSLWDSFSIATLEAMATGLPVVVSKFAGIRDILTNWKDTVLVDPLNTAKFTEILNIVMCDGKLRRKLGFNAELTAKRYSWSNVGKSLIKKFETALRL